MLDLKLSDALRDDNNYIMIRTESFNSKKFTLQSRNMKNRREVLSFRNNSIKQCLSSSMNLKIGDIRYSGFNQADPNKKLASTPRTTKSTARGYDLNGFPGGKYVSAQEEQKKLTLMKKTLKNVRELKQYF